MTQKRTGEGWLPAEEYGRSLPRLSVNLLVRDVAKSVPFYRDVLGATVRYAGEDFAALNLFGIDFMPHAEHAYDHHPAHARHGGRPRQLHLRRGSLTPAGSQRNLARCRLRFLGKRGKS